MSVFISILLNLVFVIVVVCLLKSAKKKHLLLLLTIFNLLFLCFIPTFTSFIFDVINDVINIGEIICDNPHIFISGVAMTFVVLFTYIQYLRKRKDEDTEVEEEKKARKKIQKIVMIPACVLPILVFAFILLDKSIRTDSLLLSIIITAIGIYFFLLLFFVRKNK